MVARKKQKVGLPRVDHAALLRAVAAYKKLSPRHAAELSELILGRGWRAGALHAARELQQKAFQLSDLELAPCELREQNIGGIKQVWPCDINDVDQRRPEMVVILKELQHYGLSKYEPFPAQAIALAKERRRLAPSGDAA